MITTINLTLQFGDEVDKPLDFPVVFESIKMYIGFRLKNQLPQKKFFDSYLSKFMIPLGYKFSTDFFESNNANNGSWESVLLPIGGNLGEQNPRSACLNKQNGNPPDNDYYNV
jgi:hypothetical protein